MRGKRAKELRKWALSVAQSAAEAFFEENPYLPSADVEHYRRRYADLAYRRAKRGLWA